jgi:hypothetical protein
MQMEGNPHPARRTRAQARKRERRTASLPLLIKNQGWALDGINKVNA